MKLSIQNDAEVLNIAYALESKMNYKRSCEFHGYAVFCGKNKKIGRGRRGRDPYRIKKIIFPPCKISLFVL